jgi:predicted HicB family RNase H-like nuclease
MSRINIELPEELHKKAKVYCAEKGITLIELVTKAVEEALKRK